MKADAQKSAARKFWRVLIVVSLSAFVLGTTQPNILAAIRGISEGTFGLTFDHFGIVTHVAPGLPADRAGIVPADQITPVSYKDRVTAYVSNISTPGTQLHITVRHGNAIRTLTLTSVAVDTAAIVLISVVKRLTSLVFVLIGAGLLLLRPSRMTWGLFLFTLSANGLAGPLYFFIFGPGVYVPISLALSLIGSIGGLGLWIFASRFPNDQAPGWRAWFDRAAPWLALPLIATQYPFWHSVFTGAQYGSLPYYLSVYFPVVVESVGILILLATYLQEHGEARQRVKWVVAGFAVGFASDGLTTLLAEPHVQLWPAGWAPTITPDILFAAWIVTPISIAYAVLKHHVIDVRFAVSRAIVYAMLTSVAVAAFAFIDWIFTEKLSAARLGNVAEVGAAVAIGFWFNSLHRRIDLFVDGVLFRNRHLAEKRLALAASALPHATSLPAAAELLTAEPVHAFELTSGATFMRADDDSFRRVFAIGWEDRCLTQLPHDDLLIARLRATREALTLYGLYWPAVEGCPEGTARPILAMPVFIRSQLAAIAFFGAHGSGEAFDPDELSSLHALCTGASAAFDHLEAEQRRVENESLRKVVEQLSGRASITGIATA